MGVLGGPPVPCGQPVDNAARVQTFSQLNINSGRLSRNPRRIYAYLTRKPRRITMKNGGLTPPSAPSGGRAQYTPPTEGFEEGVGGPSWKI